ncbi:MAG: hypothetical protein H6709_13620 [Kofleriaceae bacterium]|nr:hypothetical protein [Kofleriaceae bacterium]MCB9573117.1 hypothetical protein [Kofleriaceae bacterium]
MSELDLPPIHEALLDAATLGQLFLDVATVTEVLGVSIKGGPRTRAEDAAGEPRAQLARAHELLDAGVVAGVQLRYRHDGRQWWDTLMRAPGGVRLIRVCHDDVRTTEPTAP